MSNKISKKIHVFENQDKAKFKESKDPDNIGNLIHPFRAVIAGPPSCGKTSTIKNLIIHQRPVFNRIIVYHIDPYGTQEYNDLECEMVDELPDKNEIDSDIKTLLICEDIPYRDLNKKEKIKLDSFLRYVSSHKSTSIIMSCQDAITGSSPNFRRMANVWCLYRSVDMNPVYSICRNMGINKNIVQVIFENFIKSKHNFLMIDKSESGPEMRIDIFEPITFSK